MNIYTKIGARIKLARLEKGLTQEELADKTGVTSVMISRYEGGKTSPMRKLDKISEILGVNIDYFFSDGKDEDLYEEVRTLVSILRENVQEYIKEEIQVPFITSEELTSNQSLTTLIKNSSVNVSIPRADIVKTNTFATKVDKHFETESIPSGTILICTPLDNLSQDSMYIYKSDNKLRIGNSSNKSEIIAKIEMTISK